jgi:hypothetical protein
MSVAGRWRWIGVAAAVILVGLERAPANTGAAPAYVPGLGEIMAATQMRHLKLWYAGEARNWPLAAYEVDELEEGFADAAHYHPRHKTVPRPVGELIAEFTAAPMAALRAAIAAQDTARFVAAYDALTTGCNGCHAVSHFGFNIVVRPRENPYGNQQFALPATPAAAR